MKEKVLYIRADGNEILGMGHLMRCFALAKEWEKQYGPSCFFTADETARQVVLKHGFKAVCLNSSWKNLDDELDVLTRLLKKAEARLLLVDSYYYKGHYIEVLKRYCKIAAIGDKASVDCQADIVINYNIYADKCIIKDTGPGNAIYLLGTEYYPLRDEFQGKRIIITGHVKNIYLSSGSTDPMGILPLLAKRLLAEGFCVEAVTGSFNQQIDRLKELEQNHENFHLHINIGNVSEVMEKCQLAVSAAGITLYELCALGIPSIIFAFADNQLPGAKAFQEKKFMISVGDIRGYVNDKVNEIVDKVLLLRNSPQCMMEMSERTATCVDGKGTRRILDILEKQYDL